jgi:hypothetical protein
MARSEGHSGDVQSILSEAFFPPLVDNTGQTADPDGILTGLSGGPTPLIDNSGGTASGTTVVAMPDPADTPATADALRDDLVANFIPPLRDNIATLTNVIAVIINNLTGETDIATLAAQLERLRQVAVANGQIQAS